MTTYDDGDVGDIRFDPPTRHVVDVLAAEMLRTPTMALDLQPETVFQFVALFQLACRHPGVGDSTRIAARRFIQAATEYFAASPNILALIAAGDNPAHDLPWDRPRP